MTWCIISAYRPDLVAPAQHALRTHADIEVVTDRRIGERRRPERRLERRRHDIDEILRAYGYAIIARAEVP